MRTLGDAFKKGFNEGQQLAKEKAKMDRFKIKYSDVLPIIQGLLSDNQRVKDKAMESYSNLSQYKRENVMQALKEFKDMCKK